MRPIVWQIPCSILFSLLCSACASDNPVAKATSEATQNSAAPPAPEQLIVQAENQASLNGQKVLTVLRKMIENGEIIKGGCWDYLDEGWHRAGFTRAKRRTVFKGSLKHGPYANPDLIKAGDWLYYVNHSYGDIEHSGVFVAWTDKAQYKALIISYPGEQRQEPGRYSVYDISHVYRIIRPQ